MTRFTSLLALTITLAGCPTPSTEVPEPTCLQDDTPGVTAWWSASECTQILFECEPDEVMFGDACGCGCQLESACIDPNVDATTMYLEKSECLTVLLQCEDGETQFEDACGCGCLP